MTAVVSSEIPCELPHSPVTIITEPVQQYQKSNFSQSVLIFDWDDTLCCSTYLVLQGMSVENAVISQALQDQLTLLETAVIELLSKAKSLGTVVIITNSENGWVEYSCKRFLPRVVPYLQGIRIISARSLYEPLFPQNPLFWKWSAFSNEIRFISCTQGQSQNNYPINVLSFGDSFGERYALLKLTNEHNMIKKSIKLMERPTSSQLQKQITYITCKLDELVDHNNDLDVFIK